MAKKSSIEKNNRRKRMTKNAAPARAADEARIIDGIEHLAGPTVRFFA